MEEKKTSNAKKVFIIVMVTIAVILIGLLLVNESLKNSAVEKLSNNLVGKTFDNNEIKKEWYRAKVYYSGDYYQPVNKTNHIFTFNDDGTVTCTYNYFEWDNDYAIPVTLTYGYSVEYEGDFIYDPRDVYIVLDYGDKLYTSYPDENARKERIPNKMGFSGDEHFAPDYQAELRNANGPAIVEAIEKLKQPSNITLDDTKEVLELQERYEKLSEEQKNQISNYSKLAAAVKKSNQLIDASRVWITCSNCNGAKRIECISCNGTGLVKYYYGGSDLEAVLSGHDPYTVKKCTICNETGKKKCNICDGKGGHYEKR